MASRSKSGCITCRIRRVKCDETKPECKKCQTSRRVCDGYISEERSITRRQLAEAVRDLSAIGPVARALSQTPLSANPLSRPVSPDDAVLFNLFRNSTVPSTCSILPSSFWQRTVMQMAHGEPALWHATVALGSLHQRATALALQDKDEEVRLFGRAVAHYGRAMALGKDLHTPIKLATLSVALVAAATMLNYWSEMHAHIMSGLKILAKDNSHTPVIRGLVGSMMRIDLQAMTWSESSSPYPHQLSSDAMPVGYFLMSPVPQNPTYEDLASEMFGLGRAYFLLHDAVLAGFTVQGPMESSIHLFSRRLVRWEERITEYEATHPILQEEKATMLSLHIYHVTIRTLLHAGPFGPETRFDRFLSFYEHIINLVAAFKEVVGAGNGVGLSLEPGVIIPLWMTAHRCRHYGLRRAAIKLLEDFKRVEGMWRSEVAASILRTVRDVEEGSLGATDADTYEPAPVDPLAIPPTAWSKPNFVLPGTVSWSNVPEMPEGDRVKDIIGMANLRGGYGHLRLLMASTTDDAPYGPTKEFTVYF